jgi:hypothetical protein
MLNQSIEFLNTSVLHENQSKDIQRVEDKGIIKRVIFNKNIFPSPVHF